MQASTKSSTGPMIIVGILFFVFGFATWINGTLIPYLKIACELTDAESLLVASAFYISYFVMALPSSWVLKQTGFKKGMMLGLVVMAVGALTFIPAATTRTYGLFLTGLFIIGTGLSLLQTAVNPYVTIVGPIDSAARRISIMGICNKVGGMIGPLVLGAIILSDADQLTEQLRMLDPVAKEAKLHELTSRVIVPYITMATLLIGLALLVRFSPLPELEAESDNDEKAGDGGSILRFPYLVLGVLALFLYVGAEVIAGDTIGLFGQAEGIPLSDAKNFTSYTMAAMVVGYVAGIFAIPKLISQSKALALSAIVGILFSIGAIVTEGYTAVLFIALLGLANALVWPAIWPLAIGGLGRHTKTGSAMLIMAIAGGAVLPPLWGMLAKVPSIGHNQAYWILVPCYLFILYYSISGYKLKRW